MEDTDTKNLEPHALAAADPGTAPSVARVAAQLVMLVGESVGRVYSLGALPVLIGRASDVDLQIKADDVSRHHARVYRDERGFVVEDLGSKNGTSVNGRRVTQHTLAIGDRLQIAASAILVYGEPDELEQRVLRLQRLETMTTFAAGLAHDFRNLLGIITTNTDFLIEHARSQHPGDSTLVETLTDVIGAAEKAAHLTQQIVDFARRQPLEQRPAAVAVRPVVDEVVSQLRHALAPSVTLAVNVPSTLVVLADRTELHQILWNLCLNARDAMPDGGTLGITVFGRRVPRADALTMHLAQGGPYIEFLITDTGVGMNAATLAHLFEPFFTTKVDGRGTGLGLASVHGIVRSRGGSVLVASSPGAGSTFRVLLPAAVEALDGGATAKVPAP